MCKLTAEDPYCRINIVDMCGEPWSVCYLHSPHLQLELHN